MTHRWHTRRLDVHLQNVSDWPGKITNDGWHWSQQVFQYMEGADRKHASSLPQWKAPKKEQRREVECHRGHHPSSGPLCSSWNFGSTGMLSVSWRGTPCSQMSSAVYFPLKSLVNHLVSLNTTVQEAILQQWHLVAIIFDLVKTYNTTWCHAIMKVLHEWGLRGRLHLFLYSFLSHKTSRVYLIKTYIPVTVWENGSYRGLSPVLHCLLWQSMSCHQASTTWYGNPYILISTYGTEWQPYKAEYTLFLLPWQGIQGQTCSWMAISSTYSRLPNSLARALTVIWMVDHIKELKAKSLRWMNVLHCLEQTGFRADQSGAQHLYNLLVLHIDREDMAANHP